MVGHGPIGGLPPGFPAQSVTNFSNAWTWVHNATEPVDSSAGQWDSVSRDDAAEVGPCLAFGDELARLLPDYEIVIIPAAKDASQILAWQRANGAVTRSTLYGSLVARANYVRNFGKLGGMFWVQGSGDAWHLYDANVYQQRTEQFFADLRFDLQLPQFMIVYAQEHPTLPNAGYTNGWPVVRAAQAAMQSPINLMVPVLTSCVRNADNLHYGVACQLDLGVRAAQAWFAANQPPSLVNCGP